MLPEESQWLSTVLASVPTEDLSPVLNLGSSTVVQPFIHENIFKPLEDRNCQVIHVDEKEAAGVDIAGDLLDDSFWEKLEGAAAGSLMCCNILEHLTDPLSLCARIESVMQSGSHLFVTVPNRFPYHKDPIDTMFRPTSEQVARLFPNCEVIQSELIEERNSWFDTLRVRPRYAALMTVRCLLPFYKFQDWLRTVSYLPSVMKPFLVSCVWMRRR
jgi:hypothetical protein